MCEPFHEGSSPAAMARKWACIQTGAQGQVRQQPLTVIGSEEVAEVGHSLRRSVGFTDEPQSGDQQACHPSRSRHHAGHGAPQFGGLLPVPNLAGFAVGEKGKAGRYLIGQPQEVRGIAAKRLQFDMIALGQRFCRVLHGRKDIAEHWAFPGPAVQSAGNPAQRAGVYEAGQRLVNGRACVPIQKLTGIEDGIRGARFHATPDLVCCAVVCLGSGHYVR